MNWYFMEQHSFPIAIACHLGYMSMNPVDYDIFANSNLKD